ncbi:MAG: sigma factor-like helix-turn-helix DNA-binding protein [Oscillospiraceae bacterium]
MFVRRYWYASPVEEIARDYGFSLSKVKTSLMRTRKKLKEHLESEGIVV